MKKITFHIILVLCCINLSLKAQVVDTTININSWELKHNFSRFEDTQLDTTIHDLHWNFNPLNRNNIAFENVGIIAGAAQNLNVFKRPETDFFLFGAGLYPYMATPDKTIFFNTRSPYSEIMYSSMLGTDWNEETIKFLHTQNMDPFSNIGIDFEMLSAKELYQNQNKRATKFTLFGNRTIEKYAAFGTFHFNRFNTEENGGLLDPDELKNADLAENWLYPVKLNEALAYYTNLQLFYTQKFMISQKVYQTDTLGVTTDSGTNFSFNHQIMAERNDRYYTDRVGEDLTSPFYDNYYYYDTDAKDSVLQDRITNTFQFILGDPYTDPLSARVYAGHEFYRYGQLSPTQGQVLNYYDTITYDPLVLEPVMKDTAQADFSNKFFNEIFLGFSLAGPPEKLWYWNIDGKYYVAGYYRNNFKANATFARTVFGNYRLGLKGNLENRNVSYFHNHYSSSFFKWDNDFKASQLIRGGAFLNNSTGRLNANVDAGIWTNYLYWDQNALPVQAEEAIYILSASLEKHFKISGFNSNNQLLFQYASNNKILRLPLAAIKSSNYFETDFFQGALKAQIGIDVFVTTEYKANAYMPATGIFYLQDQETIGGYPFLDAYLGIRVQRVRFFISYNNGLAGILSNNYFTAAGYATKPAFLRLGIAWTFYD